MVHFASSFIKLAAIASSHPVSPAPTGTAAPIAAVAQPSVTTAHKETTGPVAAPAPAPAPRYSATYTPGTLPVTSEKGQGGTNQCSKWGASAQDSMCQNVVINAVDDFCLWAPAYSDGKNATIGVTERTEVSWCTKAGYGTRLIPDGTLQGVHFVQTPDYVQVTGVGNFANLGIPVGDTGGELDPHGADGNGNPIGGLVFGNSYGSFMQYHEWTNFMSDTVFCVRACKDGPRAAELCQHIYDVMGCTWNMPANYATGTFESCKGEDDSPMGVYGTSTFHQGDPVTPSASPAAPSSMCSTVSTIPKNGVTPNGVFTASATPSSSIAGPSGLVAIPSQASPSSDGGNNGTIAAASPSTGRASAAVRSKTVAIAGSAINCMLIVSALAAGSITLLNF